MLNTHRFKTVLLLLLTLFILTACSNSKSKEEISNNQIAKSLNENQYDSVNNADVSIKSDKKQTISGQAAVNRKLIKTADLQLETKKFDKTITALENAVNRSGGYIESNHINGSSLEEKYNKNNSDQIASRNATYTLRIPTSRLNTFINNLYGIGNVISKTISTEDISNQYFDTETRVKSLKIQEERLLALLKKSGNLKDIIEIEKQLTDVRYEIETLTTTLKTYDSLINYSTINLSINEVAIMTDTTPPKTVGDRISAKFKQNIASISNGFKNTTVFIIGNSLLIFIWLMILAGIYLAARKAMKKYQEWNLSK